MESSNVMLASAVPLYVVSPSVFPVGGVESIASKDKPARPVRVVEKSRPFDSKPTRQRHKHVNMHTLQLGIKHDVVHSSL